MPLPVSSNSPAHPSDEPNQNVRVSYAYALRVAGRWQSALDELREIHRLNIEFTQDSIGDLSSQALRGGASSSQVQESEALEHAAVPKYDPHDCPNPNIPESTPPIPANTPLSRVSIAALH